jgi:hypothetical protein
MLPILRTISVGGVSLAIVILVLALSPPGAFRPSLPAVMLPARGALIARAEHPEWRQFLMVAALRRADEVQRLRQLSAIPTPNEMAQPAAPKPGSEVAGLPGQGGDVTGAVTPAPDATIPIGIGESSSTELPVIPHAERPPVIMTPARNAPSNDSLNIAPAGPTARGPR